MNQSITICLTQIQKYDDIEIKIIFKCISHFQASCIIGFYGFVLKIAEKCNLESSRYNSGQGN